MGTGARLDTKDEDCPGQAAPKHVFVARTAMSTTKDTVSTFLERERLCSIWDLFPINFTFSSGQSCSTIDHFFISNTQQGIIFGAGAIHDPENLSGHSPVYLKIDLAKANKPPEKISRNPRLNWGRLSEDQQASYTQQLRDQLSQPEPEPECYQCDDVICSNRSHLPRH